MKQNSCHKKTKNACSLFYPFIRKILFRLDPERAHHLTMKLLDIIPKKFFPKVPEVPCEIMGLTFPNPVGLAAGLDKDGDHIAALAKIGFGFIELGTVTPQPQIGNPKPRLFRLPEESALINRLGFNNKGVDYLIERLKEAEYPGIIGVNIGKNADTPLAEAKRDYLHCLEKVYPYADYVAINISSPNTPGLRELQHNSYLKSILSTLCAERVKLNEKHDKRVPLVVKISPDLNTTHLQSMADVFLQHDIDGIIATNTTVARGGLKSIPYAKEAGGLSGQPLLEKASHIVKELDTLLEHKIPFIGVGGIMSGKDAAIMMQAGASLVQVYTGLIYRGPHLVSEIISTCCK